MSDSIVHSLKDVAKLCNAHPSTVRGWVKKGMPRIPREGSAKYDYDILKIQEWRVVRLTGNQGGEVVSMSDEELELLKAKIEKFRGAIDYYKINRADIFANKQLNYQKKADFILSTITDEDIKDEKIGMKLAALKVLDTGAAIFYDKERLERGESTQNVGILVASIKELKRKRGEPKPVGEASRAAAG